jgi:hypothetical protein
MAPHGCHSTIFGICPSAGGGGSLCLICGLAGQQSPQSTISTISNRSVGYVTIDFDALQLTVHVCMSCAKGISHSTSPVTAPRHPSARDSFHIAGLIFHQAVTHSHIAIAHYHHHVAPPSARDSFHSADLIFHQAVTHSHIAIAHHHRHVSVSFPEHAPHRLLCCSRRDFLLDMHAIHVQRLLLTIDVDDPVSELLRSEQSVAR